MHIQQVWREWEQMEGVVGTLEDWAAVQRDQDSRELR